MEIEEVRNLGRELRARLGLRTYPVGIKFCGEDCDVSRFKRPQDFGVHMAVCQVINTVRRHGKPIAFKLEDMFCMVGAYIYGLVPEYPEYLGEVLKWHTSSEEVKSFLTLKLQEKALPQGSIKAVVVTPLETAEVVPDVAVIYGTPTQISAIARALIWHGIFPEISSNWFFTCSAAVGAHRSKRPHVSIPSSGEVVWGWSEEDEVSVSLPVEHLEKILTGLENIKRIYPYPPARFMLYEPLAPRGYRITYKDYLEWKKSREEKNLKP
jgi:uncharacterized protein (DUF169 family)